MKEWGTSGRGQRPPALLFLLVFTGVLASGFSRKEDLDRELEFSRDSNSDVEYGHPHMQRGSHRNRSSTIAAEGTHAMATEVPRPSGHQLCFPQKIPKVTAKMQVKVGGGSFEERRIYMDTIEYDFDRGTFRGINILIWPQGIAAGAATMANIKLHAVAELDAFEINENAVEAKAQVLAIDKSKTKNPFRNALTKMATGSIGEITIKPRNVKFVKLEAGESKGKSNGKSKQQEPAAAFKPNMGKPSQEQEHKNKIKDVQNQPTEKLNYWSYFVELVLCSDYFKKVKADAAIQGSLKTLEMLQKHFKAAKGNKNLVRAHAQVQKKTTFGKSVEAMLDFLKGDENFDEMEEGKRVEHCYRAYQKWNGENFPDEERQMYDYDKDKYFQEMKSTVTTANTYRWSDYFRDQDLGQFLAKNPSSTAKDLSQFLAKNPKSTAKDLNSYGWVKFQQKGHIGALGAPGFYSIRITIMLEGTSAVERSQLLWKLMKDAFGQMSTRKVQFGKVIDPANNKAKESMILSWLPDTNKEPENFAEAKHRILANRQTYSEICKYLKTHYVGKLRDPKKLLPFQYREEGCPASISTYFGGYSFGEKLCKAIALKGDLEENTAIYADNGGTMEEFWTFADWMVKDNSLAEALATGVLNGLTGHK